MVKSLWKKILKRFQQYMCSHEVVRTKSGAKHKAGWNHLHKVTCTYCEKSWKMKGEDIYHTYGKEKECYCKFEKGKPNVGN